MNDKRYQYILYIIAVVIVATIGIQGYWNYKNYLSNKQQLINDVQYSLDKSVDDYYANLAEKTTLGLRFNGDAQKKVFDKDGVLEKISSSIDKNNQSFEGLDSLSLNSIDGITVIKGLKSDSFLIKEEKHKFPFWTKDSITHKKSLRVIKTDSESLNEKLELLTSKVFISITNDTLDINKIDSLFKANLKLKTLDLEYKLNYKKPNKQFQSFFKKDNKKAEVKIDTIQNNKLLGITSKSTFLPKNSTLSLHFENVNWVAFKKGVTAILISIILILAVISCLFFLLKIIKNQKQLAEVKNDLISNITHEFKTPIATIGVALESINNFNVIDDKEKTKKYVDMSSTQLSKLNLMVEKLLETATLDSETLEFNKESLDITLLLDTLVNRYKVEHQEKTFKTDFGNNKITTNTDPFHFENALNNILDNAVKYGGDEISIHLNKSANNIKIQISDDGNTLKNESKNRIFEKFYRVPKGNTHDIKGYGIGLYYTKTIIDKHGGSIALDLNNNLTSFKILLPND